MKKFITSDEYEELHQACPVCGNRMLIMTMLGIPEYDDRDYEDKQNKVYCEKDLELEIDGCGWQGLVHDLVP
jgi:hypothetical protein